MRLPSRLLSFMIAVIAAVLLAGLPLAAGGGQESVPSFTKVFSLDTIGPGSTSTLTFTITNGLPGPVTDLAFTDTLPAGVTIANPASASTTCQDATLSAPDGGTTITFSGGAVGANSSCTVTVNVTGTSTGTHMNTSGPLTSSAGNSGTATDDLVVDGGLPGFSKAFSPGTVTIGGRSTLTFTVDNTANESSVPSLEFLDTLPAGMVIADPANASTTCGTTSGFLDLTADPGTNVVSLFYAGSGSFPGVPGGSTCEVVVDVVGNAAGVLANASGNLDINATAGQDTLVGKATAALTVTTATLTLTKSFTDDPTPPGDTVTLEFTITNTDRDFTATGVAFTDDLDAALSGLAAESTPQSDVCGVGSQISGTGTLSLTGGTLPPGGSCTFSVTVRVPGAAAPGTYPNTTSAVTGTINGVGATGTAGTDTLFVQPVPRLTKTFTDDPTATGSTVTLEFTITNTSTAHSATSIAFSDTFENFPGLLTSDVVLPANGFCGGGSTIAKSGGIYNGAPGVNVPVTVSVSGASLAAAGSCTFDLTITVPLGLESGDVVNTTSSITATVDGASYTGSPATDTLSVIGAPQLTKEFTDDPAQPGGTATLEFTLTHQATAPSDATNITFTDDLKAALSGLTATGLPQSNVCGGGSQISGTMNLTFTGGTLAPGASCTFSVTVSVPAGAAPGIHTNTTSQVTATVSGVTATGPAVSDDLVVAGLSLTKTFTNDPVLPGGTVDLEFTLQNSSGSDAASIAFSDDLTTVYEDPSGPDLTFDPASLPASCQISGGGTTGTIALSSGDRLLTFSSGSLVAGASCTFTVTLDVPASMPSNTYANVVNNFNADLGGGSTLFANARDNLVVNGNLLTIQKQFTDDPVVPGGTVTLEFTLSNLDQTNAATAVAFSDDLGAALSGLVADSLVSNTCGGTVTGFTTSNLSFSGGSIAAGGSCVITVSVSVPVVASGTTAVNTTSSVTGTIGGLGVTGDPATDTLKIDTLTFTKSFNASTIAGGSPVLTFTITNLSTTTTFSDLSFFDDLGSVVSGLVATGGLPANPCGAGSTLTGTSLLVMNGGTLAPGASCSFAVTLAVPAAAAPGSFVNTTSDLLQSGLKVAEPATATLTILPSSDLSLTKTDSPDPVLSGGVLTYTVTVTNGGPQDDATTTTVTDTLPAGVVFQSATGTGWACGHAGGVITCTRAGGITLGAAPPITITVMVNTTTPGPVTNTASVSSPQIDPNVGANDTNVAEQTTINVTMYTLTVVFSSSGGGRVTSSDGNIDCPGDCVESYPVVTTPPTVTLAHTVRDDSSVARITPASCLSPITMNQNVTCDFTFARLPLGPASLANPAGDASPLLLGPSLALDADAAGDIFAYADASGAWARLLGNGSTGFTIQSQSTWDPGYLVRAARFDTDALTDLLLYNQTTGVVFKAINDGAGNFTFFDRTWSPGWQPFILDLNGDGVSDVFLYDPLTGAWYRATSDPASPTGDFTYVFGTWDPGWEVYPMELDGAGPTDVLVHDATTGAYYRAVNDGVADFTCDAAGTSCSVPQAMIPLWSPGWEVHPGDFNNDGLSDVLLYNAATGQYYIGTNTGVDFSFPATAGSWSPGWTIRIGDFNGDGLADAFVYNVTTGAWFMELNDGAGGFTDHGGTTAPGWEISVVQLDGDGISDLLLYDPATGASVLAITTGPGTFTTGVGAFDPAASIIAEVPRVP